MRVFIAFDLPDSLKDKVLNLEKLIKKETKRIRLTGRDNLHITIKFMGELPKTAVERVSEILREESKSLEPFKINLNRAGVFKDFVNPKVLWLGEDNNRYVEMSNTINEKLSIFRPNDNKPFCHLTIGRIKWIEKQELTNVLEICDSFIKNEDLSFEAREFFIFESQLHKSGAVYRKLEKFSLRCSYG